MKRCLAARSCCGSPAGLHFAVAAYFHVYVFIFAWHCTKDQVLPLVEAMSCLLKQCEISCLCHYWQGSSVGVPTSVFNSHNNLLQIWALGTTMSLSARNGSFNFVGFLDHFLFRIYADSAFWFLVDLRPARLPSVDFSQNLNCFLQRFGTVLPSNQSRRCTTVGQRSV